MLERNETRSRSTPSQSTTPWLRPMIAALVAVAVAGAGVSVSEEAGMSRQEATVLARISPLGRVNVAKADAAPAAPRSGQEVAAAVCNACHATGALEAPKIGDGANWSARLNSLGGVDGLLKSSIAGKGAMPPRGGGNVSDEELRGAIEYMLKESGIDIGSASAAAEAPAPAPAPAASNPMVAATDMMGAAVSAVTGTVEQATTQVAKVMAPQPAVAGPDLAKGKAVYDSACFVCHATGAAGAPLLGDVAKWGPRIDQGKDTMMFNALNGKGGMPPRGGRMDLSDEDISVAIDYMISKSS